MKMAKRLLSLLLAAVLLTLCLTACSAEKKNLGKPMLRLEKTEFSENLFALYLSRLKGSMCSAYLYGEEAKKDSFWDKYKDSNGLTYNDYYTEQVLSSAKMSTAVMHLFEEYELSLSDGEIEKIEKELAELMAEDAEGSKNKFNELLLDYGANYDVLREAHIIEKKFSKLTDHLLGANGEKLGAELIEQYYLEHYARFKQIFIYTSGYVYETDENGDEIYYTKEGTIAYDRSAIEQEKTDRFGNRIYLQEDGRVAYDTAKGTRKQLKDSSGGAMIETFSGERLESALALADEVYAKTEKGDTVGFEELIGRYNENRATESYANGYYITQSTSTDVVPKALNDALFALDVGEVAKVRTELGVHIFMRYELDEGAYADKDNSDFFISMTTGTYVFTETLKSEWMREYLAPYIEKVELVDESVLERYNMKSIAPNARY